MQIIRPMRMDFAEMNEKPDKFNVAKVVSRLVRTECVKYSLSRNIFPGINGRLEALCVGAWAYQEPGCLIPLVDVLCSIYKTSLVGRRIGTGNECGKFFWIASSSLVISISYRTLIFIYSH